MKVDQTFIDFALGRDPGCRAAERGR